MESLWLPWWPGPKLYFAFARMLLLLSRLSLASCNLWSLPFVLPFLQYWRSALRHCSSLSAPTPPECKTALGGPAYAHTFSSTERVTMIAQATQGYTEKLTPPGSHAVYLSTHSNGHICLTIWFWACIIISWLRCTRVLKALSPVWSLAVILTPTEALPEVTFLAVTPQISLCPAICPAPQWAPAMLTSESSQPSSLCCFWSLANSSSYLCFLLGRASLCLHGKLKSRKWLHLHQVLRLFSFSMGLERMQSRIEESSPFWQNIPSNEGNLILFLM